MQRTHVVLVPGFGGFDALGQIFYYAGTGASFREWQANEPARASDVSLHYFDNLPTAGVQTRAMALRAFLEERVYRGIVAADDRIALVGHSTGGLDIRQLLVNLDPTSDPKLASRAETVLVPDDRLLGKIKRLAFLSVPQFGTNIADFTQRFRGVVKHTLDAWEAFLKTSHESHLQKLEQKLFSSHLLPDQTPEFFAALRDTVLEVLDTGDPRTPRGRYESALSRASYGELMGWLENVDTDFFAIDDLACLATEGALPTPARYTAAERGWELSAWHANGIEATSYATVGRLPFDRDPRTKAYSRLEALGLVRALSQDPIAGTDFVYRFLYAITAAGPFEVQPEFDRVREHGELRAVLPWENDGVVNTASMLWPNGEATHLAFGDHGDIVGHYAPRPPIRDEELLLSRENHSYDIFASGSGFDDAAFRAVWHGIFDFCSR